MILFSFSYCISLSISLGFRLAFLRRLLAPLLPLLCDTFLDSESALVERERCWPFTLSGLEERLLFDRVERSPLRDPLPLRFARVFFLGFGLPVRRVKINANIRDRIPFFEAVRDLGFFLLCFMPVSYTHLTLPTLLLV